MTQKAHRENLLATLANSVQAKLESVPQEHQAFVRIAAEWLGYDELEERSLSTKQEIGVSTSGTQQIQDSTSSRSRATNSGHWAKSTPTVLAAKESRTCRGC